MADEIKKVGRNDPCPCGSGKKFKKCCYEKYEKQRDKWRWLHTGRKALGERFFKSKGE
jgi:hypothetical protein